MFEIAKTAGGYASTPTTPVSFNDANGDTPEGSLIADSNGDLFGTTAEGGANDGGTVMDGNKLVGGGPVSPTIPGRAGTPSEPMAAVPTSCFKTRAAKLRSGT